MVGLVKKGGSTLVRLRDKADENVDQKTTHTPQAHSYSAHMQAYARRIRASRDTAEIIRILQQAVRETHALESTELQGALERVAQTEREIEKLKADLQQALTLVQVDQLTHSLNRRGLEKAFAREAARSERYGLPLCLVMIDLDNFKLINDRYGHPAGDEALVHLARTMVTSLRPNDVIARYGGEEFVVLLPDSGQEAAFVAISRVQRALLSRPVTLDSDPVALQFSAGVALRRTGEALDPLLARADDALLAAKRAGKNRILFAAGPGNT
jgi:diguanylate cyclase